MTDEIEFWQAGEWTMVYLNGELQRAGDHYLADEWLQQHFGVVVVDDPDSCSVPDGHHALKLLDEARESLRLDQERKEQAAELRRQAEELCERAKDLEK